MRNRTQKYALALVLAAFPAGCSSHISNHVGSDEYALYSEWMNTHFAKGLPSSLYVADRTMIFDPTAGLSKCSDGLHQRAGVPWALINQLHDLGEAEYRLTLYPPGSNLRVPFEYKVVDHWRDIGEAPPGTYRLITFSRIAFDRSHRKALFAISNSCGGECGGGGAVYATMKEGAWTFENPGCNWVY